MSEFCNKERIFQDSYDDSFGVVDLLSKYIFYCMKEAKQQHQLYVAPYIALCQSSGVGKTATALQLRKQFLVFYVCFRRSDSSGEPKRTPVIADLFASVNSTDNYYKLLNACFLTFYEKYIYEHDPKTYENNIIAFHDDICYSSCSFWSEVKTCFDSNGTSDSSALQSSCIFSCNQIISALSKSDSSIKTILFVFDEARELIEIELPAGTGKNIEKTSPFRLLRTALGSFNGEGTCAALFMDTNSRVANFVPSQISDPSARVATTGLKLFHPFTVLPGIAVLGLSSTFCRNNNEKFNPTENITLNYNRFEEAAQSRALFAAYLNRSADMLALNRENAVGYMWKKLMDLAQTKLLPSSPDIKELELDMFVVLAVRFCVLPMDSDTSIELVGSRMATLHAVSEDRRRLMIHYEAEPILAEVACKRMCMKDEFQHILRKIVDMRRTGNVGILYPSGEVGEFCASLLLARAADMYFMSSNIEQHYGAPLLLKDFLTHLFDSTFVNELSFPEGLDYGAVRVLQFVKCEEAITRDVILDAAQRGVALLCKNGDTGIDIVIPVIMLKMECEKSLLDLTETDISGVFIQVKNYNNSSPIYEPQACELALSVHAAANRIFEAKGEENEEDLPNDSRPFVCILMLVGDSKPDRAASVYDLGNKLVEVFTEKINRHMRKPEHNDKWSAALKQLESKLHQATHARVPTILAQTINSHYSCITEEEVKLMKDLVRPYGEFGGPFSALKLAVNMTAQEEKLLLSGLRPVIYGKQPML